MQTDLFASASEVAAQALLCRRQDTPNQWPTYETWLASTLGEVIDLWYGQHEVLTAAFQPLLASLETGANQAGRKTEHKRNHRQKLAYVQAAQQRALAPFQSYYIEGMAYVQAHLTRLLQTQHTEVDEDETGEVLSGLFHRPSEGECARRVDELMAAIAFHWAD